MKAEERHRLHTNLLRSQMDKLWEGTKTSGGMVWGLLLVVVAVVIVYWWLTTNNARRISDQWASYWESRIPPGRLDFTPKSDLTKWADAYKGSTADVAARLTLADSLYEKGYVTLFSKSPKEAQKLFEDAAGVYESLSKMTPSRDVGLRCLVGAARCRESLGEVDAAKESYKQAITRYAAEMVAADGTEHPLIVESKSRLESLEHGEGLAFYNKAEGREAWPARLPKSERTTTKPSLPDAPPFGEGDLQPPSKP
jgi:hypothetical protein